MCVIVEWRGAVCDREIKSNRDERALTRDGPRMRAGTLDSRLAQCGVYVRVVACAVSCGCAHSTGTAQPCPALVPFRNLRLETES